MKIRKITLQCVGCGEKEALEVSGLTLPALAEELEKTATYLLHPGFAALVASVGICPECAVKAVV